MATFRSRLLCLGLLAGLAAGCCAGSEIPTIIVVNAPSPMQVPASAIAADTRPPEASRPLVDDADCPAALHGGRTYYFCQFGLSWPRAEAYCRGLGGHLASLHDDADNDFAFRAANQLSHEKYWIGLNDLRRKHSFVWSDGSPVTYTHFAPGEPNDAGGREDCGQLNRYFPDDGWNDEPCEQTLRFVCESA
jgi:hypothetical protein